MYPFSMLITALLCLPLFIEHIPYELELPIVEISPEKLQDGDILLRRKSGIFSEIARNFSEHEKRYSHAGIAIKKNTDIVVFHSVTDSELGFNGVVVEDLLAFLKDVEEWGVYRLTSPLPAYFPQRLRSALQLHLDNNTAYDHDYDLSTNDKFYCTELIQYAINHALNDDVIIARRAFNQKRYVSIDDVYLNDHFTLVAQSNAGTRLSKQLKSIN